MTTMLDGEDRRGLALAGADAEIRETAEGKRFFGHGSVFDVRTAIGNPLTWGFYEEVAPGAFTKTLQEQDVRMLLDHDDFYVVSRSSAGTLHLAQDAVGLAVDSALDPDLYYVNALAANLRNGNITGMSIGFWVLNDDWWFEEVETTDGQKTQVEVRRITEIKLRETSAVTFPAFPQTDAGLRSETRQRVVRPEDEVRAVGLALSRRERGNELLEARAEHRPELNAYRSHDRVVINEWSGRVLREDPVPAPSDGPTPAAPAAPTDSPSDAEPGETTPPPTGDTDSSTPDEEPARSTPDARRTELRRRQTAARKPRGLSA